MGGQQCATSNRDTEADPKCRRSSLLSTQCIAWAHPLGEPTTPSMGRHLDGDRWLRRSLRGGIHSMRRNIGSALLGPNAGGAEKVLDLVSK